MKKQLTLILSLILVAVLFFGCGGNSSVEMDSMAGSANGMEKPKQEASQSVSDSGTTAKVPELQNQKLIRTLRLEAETEDMDLLLESIDDKIAELNGYVEEREVYNGSQYSGYRSRSASMTIRIPVEQLDQFVDHVSDNVNITSSNETVENITLSYIATQSRITALETEQTRLLELLAKAETMDDLLTIEARLTDVRTELEEVNSQLRLYDNLVDYGTIRLTIHEVQEYTEVEEEPETLWQRIGRGFKKSLSRLGNFFVELFVLLIVASPYLIPLGLIVWLIIYLRRKKK